MQVSFLPQLQLQYGEDCRSAHRPNGQDESVVRFSKTADRSHCFFQFPSLLLADPRPIMLACLPHSRTTWSPPASMFLDIALFAPSALSAALLCVHVPFSER